MKNVTSGRINAIQNAGTAIQNLDFYSELSEKELKEHHELGKLMELYSEDVLKLLLKKRNQKQ